MPQEGNLDMAIREMTEVVHGERSYNDLLDLIVGVAPRVIPGIDAVSVTVAQGPSRRLETVSATSETVRELDAVQYRTRRGPCLDAMERGVEVMASLPDGSWPELSDAAVMAGAASLWCLPVSAGGAGSGSLNLYSFSSSRPWTESRPAAATLAAQASVILSNRMTMAALGRTNQELQEAVASRTVIGQAQGILMARENITADDAFDVLRRASQRTNRKLRDIAAEIVAPFQTGSHRQPQ